ncbi:PAS domain-containing protein [Campylobacter geochelonis]|uniref:Signal-transduction sensor protein n=1 Tax=Campylobacter geochelonis TaxID=1780362 RepID=A0A128EDX3_9BACT|nr:PAS domain-containing protein [Campylobacter geochelonis]QKF70383.1 PAS sensor-containing signal transduction protein [Campylobacter geochelonis]CZE46232.1 signal-transduction sensor protein [Campylobacter geochelonis]CZE46398.1 signal-transduction sensor protein [Campylobacter geochelonis]CZE50731.1 signal-transduction sensor protein [Campylobacter geochelonis]
MAVSFNKPKPLNLEIELDSKRYIVSKTDTKGVITFANQYFVKVSGYAESELVGKPHNIIRHPDMPKIIFKMMWDRIQNGQNIMAVVKNLAKDGRYYWVITNFEIERDEKTNEITGYIAYRRAASKTTIESLKPMYKELVEAEKTGGMEASEELLMKMLKDRKMSYNDFVNNEMEKSNLKGVFGGLLGKLFNK